MIAGLQPAAVVMSSPWQLQLTQVVAVDVLLQAGHLHPERVLAAS
jgi:hypothetical protein